MNDIEGFGKNNIPDRIREQDNSALEIGAVNFGLYMNNEFFNEEDRRLAEINEQERIQMSSAIESLGMVGDLEAESLKGEAEKSLSALDAESVYVIEQAKQEVDAVSVEEVRVETQPNSESLERFDAQLSQLELEKTPTWQFEQRQKSLETQGLITSGRDPKEIAKSIDGLSGRDKESRLLPQVLKKYETAYEAVAKYKENNFPPRELFKKLFGVDPKGAVAVNYNSINIVFLLDDPSDYARAVYKKSSPNAENLENIESTGGSVVKGGLLPPELSGKVILIPKGVESTTYTEKAVEHERQHVLNGLYEDTRYQSPKALVTLEDIVNAPPEAKKDIILNYLRFERQNIDNEKMHDELAAQYKFLDLKSEQEIDTKLVANLAMNYRDDFYKNRIYLFRQELKQAGVDSALIEECLTESFQKESWREMRDAAHSLKDLEDAGLTKDEAINLVQMEPLASWAEVSRQFIEQKKAA